MIFTEAAFTWILLEWNHNQPGFRAGSLTWKRVAFSWGLLSLPRSKSSARMEMRRKDLLFLQPPPGCVSGSSKAKITIMFPKGWSLATFIYRSTSWVFRGNDLIALGFLKIQEHIQDNNKKSIWLVSTQERSELPGGVILEAAPPYVASVIHAPFQSRAKKWASFQLCSCTGTEGLKCKEGNSSFSVLFKPFLRSSEPNRQGHLWGWKGREMGPPSEKHHRPQKKED